MAHPTLSALKTQNTVSAAPSPKMKINVPTCACSRLWLTPAGHSHTVPHSSPSSTDQSGGSTPLRSDWSVILTNSTGRLCGICVISDRKVLENVCPNEPITDCIKYHPLLQICRRREEKVRLVERTVQQTLPLPIQESMGGTTEMGVF